MEPVCERCYMTDLANIDMTKEALMEELLGLYGSASPLDRDQVRIRIIYTLLQRVVTTFDDRCWVAEKLQYYRTIWGMRFLEPVLELCDSIEKISRVLPLLPKRKFEERKRLILLACDLAKDKEELVSFLQANEILQ